MAHAHMHTLPSAIIYSTSWKDAIGHANQWSISITYRVSLAHNSHLPNTLFTAGRALTLIITGRGLVRRSWIFSWCCLYLLSFLWDSCTLFGCSTLSDLGLSSPLRLLLIPVALSALLLSCFPLASNLLTSSVIGDVTESSNSSTTHTITHVYTLQTGGTSESRLGRMLCTPQNADPSYSEYNNLIGQSKDYISHITLVPSIM